MASPDIDLGLGFGIKQPDPRGPLISIDPKHSHLAIPAHIEHIIGAEDHYVPPIRQSEAVELSPGVPIEVKSK